MNQNTYPSYPTLPALSNLGNPIDLSQPVIAPGIQANMNPGPQQPFGVPANGPQDQTLYQVLNRMGVNQMPQTPPAQLPQQNAMLGMNRPAQPAQAQPIQKYASGGVIALEGGGKVAQGPGGGLDDLIPTSIDGQRAAALSDGEFVIPADVVSMMGDGSSHAGSRRLYDLVKQIRENKTGTEEQATALPFKTILERISV